MLTTQAQTIKKTPDADIWLRADILTDTSAYWKDISGNNNHAFPDSPKINLIKSSINFNPAISFDNTSL